MEAAATLTSHGWPAPAKINLFLHVVGRRHDGYHLLQTLFQFLDFCDELDFAIRTDGEIRRGNDLPGVPAEQDLVVRAARLLQSHTGCRLGAEITVNKCLPMGGGLGGGSSNAATVLLALNELWGLRLEVAALASLGLQLGADVPVFIHGHAAWAEGVGEHLTPYPCEQTPVLVIHPGCQVPTRDIFTAPDLTRDTPAIKIHHLSLGNTHNDCEPVTRRLYPEVARALKWLAGLAPARMSGTGACVFGTFDTLAQARQAGHSVPSPWTWFTAMRLNRSPLLDRLQKEQAGKV